ncbi:MAG: hypothetical protein QOH62_831 [Solirubrobacteraceae bacterium]|jgi:hypothetical protein|nr:hypothetical protein [Solirubrobacteraceae bacterium]
MARRSLRPHLNQIRTWVRQGRTDAWIAHQLEVTVTQIQSFKRENDLTAEGEAPEGAAGVDFDDEIDLRAEDDALIAAELEAEAARAEEAPDEDDEDNGDADADDDRPKRRRGRRGGRGRRPPARGKGSASTFEGTFDHGEEGYGLWLDPAVADSGVYAEHWAGQRPVEVTIEEDRIVIRRAGEDAADDDNDD